MSYSAHYSPDPYNRAPSPTPGYPSAQPQPFSPPAGGQITPGTITYTTATNPDGKVVYNPFKAVAASYQTPQGLVSGIQWIPAEATQVLPAGAMPANADFASSWSRPNDREWQREEEKRRRRDEKDAARREKERRRREKDDDRELRDARERDKRAGGGISRPGSPYAASNTGRVSPYAAPGALPRPSSPYGRPVSPYHGGGALPGRPASPYHGGGALPGRPASPYHGGGALPPRPVSPYHPSTTARPASPYHSSNTLANRPGSPYGSPALPGNATYGSYAATQAEIERKMAEVGIGSGKYSSEYERRKVTTSSGYAAAPGGQYPSTGYTSTPSNPYSATNVAGGGAYPYSSATVSPYRSTSPMPNVVQVSETVRPGSPYRPPGSPYRGNVVDGRPRSRAPSPSPYGAAGGGYPTSAHSPSMPVADQGMLPAPEGFSRPPNAAQSYTRFEATKIQDMDDFMDNIPRMPLVLVPHDVYHEDWIRLMSDLASAWVGRLPIPESARSGGRVPKRTSVAADLIDLWNSSFFIPRGVEIIMYKGRERRTGSLAGQVDTRLPGFDLYYDEVSSTESEVSDDTDSDLDDPYNAASARYGHQGGVYGRRPEGQVAELREAKKRRKEMEEDQKRKRKEKKARRRMKELEKKYSVYLTCIDQSGYH